MLRIDRQFKYLGENMKRYAFFVVLVLAIALCTQGCVCQSTCLFGGKKVRGSGDVVSEEFPVDGITGVNLATIGKLYIELGDEEKLIIEAEDNLMEYFEIDVHRGVSMPRLSTGPLMNLYQIEQRFLTKIFV